MPTLRHCLVPGAANRQQAGCICIRWANKSKCSDWSWDDTSSITIHPSILSILFHPQDLTHSVDIWQQESNRGRGHYTTRRAAKASLWSTSRPLSPLPPELRGSNTCGQVPDDPHHRNEVLSPEELTVIAQSLAFASKKGWTNCYKRDGFINIIFILL